jgi:hypothetical protein
LFGIAEEQPSVFGPLQGACLDQLRGSLAARNDPRSDGAVPVLETLRARRGEITLRRSDAQTPGESFEELMALVAARRMAGAVTVEAVRVEQIPVTADL